MPRRRYDAKQHAALAMLASVHMERVRNRAIIRARIEAELHDALNDLELKESHAANAALEAGVSKTDIGRALGTANFETIRATLARTALDARPEDFDPRTEHVRYDATSGLYLVTSPGGASYMLDGDGDAVPALYPADMDPEWWEWWDADPSGRATIHPYIKEQEAAR